MRDGYSVKYKTDDHFYQDEPLELKVGERNQDQGYAFNLMLTALDTTTGRFPDDVDSLGEIKMRLWEHSFKVEEGQDVPVNSYHDIRYQKCTPDQIASFKFEGEERQIIERLDRSLCLKEGQEFSLTGTLNQFYRRTLLLELV